MYKLNDKVEYNGVKYSVFTVWREAKEITDKVAIMDDLVYGLKSLKTGERIYIQRNNRVNI